MSTDEVTILAVDDLPQNLRLLDAVLSPRGFRVMTASSGAEALAMLVFLTGLIPLIGATIGATVIVAVVLFRSVQAGIVVAVWFLVYQQVENYFLYPRIMQRSVDVSPAATVVAVLVGGALLGVLGALLAIPIAAALQLVIQAGRVVQVLIVLNPDKLGGIDRLRELAR